MKNFSKGSEVRWKWGKGEAKGKVVEVFKKDVTRTLKDSEITRKGTPENPAYLIKREDGDEVLKLHSEIESA